jgi:hypothetical protein
MNPHIFSNKLFLLFRDNNTPNKNMGAKISSTAAWNSRIASSVGNNNTNDRGFYNPSARAEQSNYSS